MPIMHYLETRKDLEARGFIITGAVQAHPQTPVCVEYMRTVNDPRHKFDTRAIVYALLEGDILDRRLCFAHLVKEAPCSQG